MIEPKAFYLIHQNNPNPDDLEWTRQRYKGFAESRLAPEQAAQAVATADIDVCRS